MKPLYTILLALIVIPVTAQRYSLNSPDNTIQVEINADKTIGYSVSIDGKALVTPSTIGIKIDKVTHEDWKVKKATEKFTDQTITPVVAEKSTTIRDNFNELRLQFRNKLSLVFRAFNNGVAYRWESSLTDSIKIINETAQFGFNAGDISWYPVETGFYSHNERIFKQYALKQITSDSLASLPTLVNHTGTNVLISEADLFDYPGMWLIGSGSDKLNAVFPQHVSSEKVVGDRNVQVVTRDNYLAKTKGNRTFPWRVLMIGRTDGDLLNNQLVYQLSRSTNIDFSWVIPGKVAWDWWNALNIDGVDFKSGVNTETYKYYIDFAARYRLDYIILDEGWSPTTDITRSVPALNMPELMAYANSKKVGVILWVVWASLEKQMTEALDLYSDWGIKGIKVDFMQRDDQKMVNFYERAAVETAKRKLLIDFHGAYKPTGLERLYPNALTREGVYGLENSKWDMTRRIGPEHNVTLPFTRNAVGAMDYTPGAMINAQRNSWYPVFQRPMSLGTRCHQLAMYVVFTSSLQMLSDAPSNYYREPECMEFLSQVPVTWNETVVLSAKTGDYVNIARKAMNGDWYVGAMTDWTARDLQIDFSFLGEGRFNVDIWQDGVNADRNANDFAKKATEVTRNTKMNVHLAPGGGLAAIIKPVK